MNIAIFTPNQNPYSETFIQAHKTRLNGTVFYYYGNKKFIRLEGSDKLVSKQAKLKLRLHRKLKNGSIASLFNNIILTSLKSNKIEAILVEYGSHAHALSSILKKSGVPIVVHFHGFDASVTSVIQECNQYKDVFNLANTVIAVSKSMEQKLLELGCPREKLVYNVYGPNPLFQGITPNPSEKQFLSVGRFTDKKAPYYTILAFKKVVAKHPDALLLMAGDGELLNMCKNLVNYHQIQNQVQFLGVITPEEYANLLAVSLAFIQHSITADNGDCEGTPLSILEASAAGLPVISTYHAGIPDVIIHNETGLLSKEHDVDAMANHMNQILEDRDFAIQLGQNGKQRILAHFTMDRHIGLLNTVLKAAIIKA